MALLVLRLFRVQVLSVVLLAVMSGGLASADEVDEYHLKAAFLYNFAQFVEWPAEAFKSADEQIGLCVLGENPFGSALNQAVKGKTAAGRKFAVREISEPKEAGRCHILFVAGSESGRVKPVLAELKGRNVLTVGETEDFAAAGGVITFRLKATRVRFGIDIQAASSANLKISSKLLMLADNTKR
jgi:hypothetical protein